MTSDRSDIFYQLCTSSLLGISPQRSDAGNARAIRYDGSTVFSATGAGAASCNGDRMIMDGKLYSLATGEARTELTTLTTDGVESIGWNAARQPVIVANGTARLFDRAGPQLATESGIVGRRQPEVVFVNQTGGGTYTILDEDALRFDPMLSDANNAGELRVTGHANGNVAVGVGDAIVSAAGDTVIVQDAATGVLRDDRDTAFGASSVAVHGDRVAIAQRLVNTSVRFAHLVSGTLVLDNELSFTDATSPAHVAWSASGLRIAVAYHAGNMLRVQVRNLGNSPELELDYQVAADPSVPPALAWDRGEERLAIGTGDAVSLWMPGQGSPSPTVAASVTRLAWGPEHVLAVGDASRVELFTSELIPAGTSYPLGGDFAWSPTDRLAIVDGTSVRIAKGTAISNQVTLTIPPVPGQLAKPVTPTRVAWLDDSHLVVVTDHGLVGRYTVTVTE